MIYLLILERNNLEQYQAKSSWTVLLIPEKGENTETKYV